MNAIQICVSKIGGIPYENLSRRGAWLYQNQGRYHR